MQNLEPFSWQQQRLLLLLGILWLSPSWAQSDVASIQDAFRDGSLGPALVLIKGGCYQIGSPADESGRDRDESQLEVCVEDFYIGQYEITFAEFENFVMATGHSRDKTDDMGWGRAQRPVINVNREKVSAYLAWLSQKTDQKYRLPTEAEWEYAARGGTDTAYWWGAEVGNNQANCDGCGSQWDNQTTAPVGSFAPNSYGLYDTAGNVWEWTCSAYERSYKKAPSRCGQKSLTAIRGGSWGNKPRGVRSANRSNVSQDYRSELIGFRIARSP